ncbi:peptidoglycan-binding protein [Streptomyces sp. NPDC057623]|uniref:peptidoglycan-binding domain-containing protein n=1 Tax=Streptomyces sp. NPDC057623 TaxID=3346187 RepID=UPI0036C3B588
MSQPNGPVCPECGTPRASDATPACSCAHRASEAHRDARTAEAAAAEDFDPLRIRPFVELGEEPGTAVTAGTAGATRAAEAEVPHESRDLAATDDAAIPASTPTPTPTAATVRGEAPLLDADVRHSPRRGQRTLLVTGAGAALAVLLTGAYLGGLFLYDSPSRDDSVSDDVRAPVPDGSTESGTSPEGRSAGTASVSPSPSPTSSPTAPATDSSARPADSPAAPTAAPSSAGATTGAAPEPTDAQGQPPVLRLGDQGPEVTELQLRLRQIGHYAKDADGDYDREVESAVRAYQLTRVVLGDESGVYGTATRESLESETSQP